ncbi:MAG: WD40 repeat domain-containing protein, partial [Pseudomonadota bacterium]
AEKLQYKTPGLRNVLDIHANRLFETAHEHFNRNYPGEKPMTKLEAQQIIEVAFKCLTRIDENKAVRNLMSLEEITGMISEEKLDTQRIGHLLNIYRIHGNTFLLPFITKDTATHELQPDTVLDITHEALLRNWRRLDEWAWEEYRSVGVYRDLGRQIDKWLLSGKKQEHLLPGGTLKYFEKWLKSHAATPVAWLARYSEEDKEDEDFQENLQNHLKDLKEYLKKSREQLNRKNRVKTLVTTTISVLLVITVIALFWADSKRKEAIALQEQIATTAHSNSIATKAYITLEKDPTLAFRLAEQAYNIESTPLAKQVIMAAYGEMPFYKKCKKHNNQVRSAVFSHDGNFILISSMDSKATLWDKNGVLVAQLIGHKDWFPVGDFAANFSYDDKFIITANQDSTARLWDLEGNCLAVLKHNGPVNSACFSPSPSPFSKGARGIDEKGARGIGENQAENKSNEESSIEKFTNHDYLILTASSDKTARLWNMKGEEVRRFEHEGGVGKAIFSPDGNIVATTSGRISYLWNLNGKLDRKFQGHNDGIFDIKFSQSGRFIFTGGNEGNGYIWNINNGKGVGLKERIRWIATLDISSDDSLFLTGSSDGLVCIWDKNGNKLRDLNKHTAVVWSAKFSPDGTKILTASDDGTARLWDLNGTELMVFKGHTSQVLSANFSPDGKQVVTASADGTARIWNIEPKENPIFKGHTAYVVDANFSPDGKYIATAGFDNTSKLWKKSAEFICNL